MANASLLVSRSRAIYLLVVFKVGLERLEHLRQQMDQSGSVARQLITTVDGRFTNSTVFKAVPQRTTLIGRLRKDAVLHFLPQAQPQKGRRRKYRPLAPTPEQLLQDQTKPWQVASARACGQIHEFKIKRLEAVVMRMNGAAMVVQVMVIKPLGYRLRMGGKLLYRQPAFLVCTDPKLSVREFLQDYLWRWDIEVNFRDQKTILKIGQRQVRNEHSTQTAPALAVAAYSLLLLAAAQTYGKNAIPDRHHQPKWYPRPKDQRATTNELINQLRIELWASSLRPAHFSDFMTAPSTDQKASKIRTQSRSCTVLIHLLTKPGPNSSRMEHPKIGKYWLVSARSAKWGLNERKTFNNEEDALKHARQIETSIIENGKVG